MDHRWAGDREGGLEVVEAEIRVAGRAVRYLRAGEGPPLLLLWDGDPGAPQGAPHGDPFMELAREHRVFRPLGTIPCGRAEAEEWLQGLVEGLGLPAPQVVAQGEIAPLLVRFVRRNGGVVGRVVFLPPAGDPDGAPGAL